MNDQPLPLTLTTRTLLIRALAALKDGDPDPNESFARLLGQLFEAPTGLDRGCRAYGLRAVEAVLFRLVLEVEWDAQVADAVAELGAGEDSHRPTPVLLARVAGKFAEPLPVKALLDGPLFASGMLGVLPGRKPLHRAALGVSDSILAVLGLPAAVDLPPLAAPRDIPDSYRHAAARLGSGPRRICRVVRGATGDASLFAVAVAEARGKRAVRIPEALQTDKALGAALTLADALPVDIVESVPGKRRVLAALPGFVGERIAVMGRDGGVDVAGWDCVEYPLPSLDQGERDRVWSTCGGIGHCPERAGPTTLAAIASRLGHGAADRRTAGAAELRPELEPHATEVAAHVPDSAMVASPDVRAGLELLLERCRQRHLPRDHLGAAFHAKGAGGGLKAMLCGPSGGGKTLAAAWLASKLDQPLFKVDLSSVVSKYIGETEENLARVLDRAEQSDVILLFDEADSLFGARTETRDSSDRFANNQTNFLLGRIEDHDGIVLLTTNARQRIDPAFARRLDQVIEMVSPDARQRQALWRAHLGDRAEISPRDMTRLANAVDLSGGHIRAIVLTADVMAVAAARKVSFDDICAAVTLHYRGIGRSAPGGLRGPA